MDENATRLIYQAVYIAIFIVATSLTINLFQTINNYTENVSNYVRDNSISDAVIESENMYVESVGNELNYSITGYELFAIVNNYGLNGSNARKYNNTTTASTSCKVKVRYISDNISKIDLNAEYKVVSKELDGDIYIVTYEKK